ncbi:hypothetical protein NDA11_007260 [Ustilago hordei]|nr:hypothetical protein NDA12_005278 [Ustilago hordei]KAJ1589415.1 hypothetical protein NDA15_005192 [Ustilago hordei]KAJ1591219.1 hypothetical protein NDA11_007260 [Ustilago hordei]KAJ1600610.1 hypothetical protein NDA14_001857 [Ustilago hordei]UTT93030.1 hypothetical protein NDA17_005830 [Ustilago hordei]
MIQMLTHVLGSSEAAISWPYQATPGSQLAPSPFGHYGSSPAHTPSQSQRSAVRNIAGSKAELSTLQPLIQGLLARLGKDQPFLRRPVGEKDLTALLQTLMEQQQRQQQLQQGQQNLNQGPGPGQQANTCSGTGLAYAPHAASTHTPSSRSSFQDSFVTGHTAQNGYQSLQFADLDFEDEDEDDPDFNPDLNPDLPLPSAWSLAVQDVVASEESRAAASAAAAAAATSHSGTPSGAQTPAEHLRLDKDTTTRSHTGSTSRSPRRQATIRASASTLGLGDTPFSVPDILFSPSGRPVRASRKPQGSPTPASHTRQTRTAGRDLQFTSIEDAGLDRRYSTELLQQGQQQGSTPSTHPHSQLIAREENSVPSRALSAPVQRAQAATTTAQYTDTDSRTPRKRGRKPVLEPGEAQRRRAQRNVEYQRIRRQVKKVEESEQSETVLELKAEVKMLRAEVERLRDENAMLRAQRELDRLQRSGSK